MSPDVKPADNATSNPTVARLVPFFMLQHRQLQRYKVQIYSCMSVADDYESWINTCREDCRPPKPGMVMRSGRSTKAEASCGSSGFVALNEMPLIKSAMQALAMFVY